MKNVAQVFPFCSVRLHRVDKGFGKYYFLKISAVITVLRLVRYREGCKKNPA